MSTFEIFTDSSCDLPKRLIEKNNLHVMQLQVLIDDNPSIPNDQIDIKEFYDKLRAGSNAKTSAVAPAVFEDAMRKVLEEGKDILYVGFSSGLSATYANAMIAVNELREEFPQRKIYDVDTLCASMGQGLMACYAAELRDAGEGIEAVCEKLESIKQYIHHQVTANDLFFLMRGGRVSATAAVAGSILHIKPIIVVNDKGCLVSVGKSRGRKGALKDIYERFKATENMKELPYVFISNSDCLEDAKKIEEMILADYPQVKVEVFDIGPVIGAHTGPGTIAVGYLGKSIKGTDK